MIGLHEDLRVGCRDLEAFEQQVARHPGRERKRFEAELAAADLAELAQGSDVQIEESLARLGGAPDGNALAAREAQGTPDRRGVRRQRGSERQDRKEDPGGLRPSTPRVVQ